MAKKALLPFCNYCKTKRVTKARNQFCSHECAQAESRAVVPAVPSESVTGTAERIDVTKTTTENVKTLADLVRVCEIDTAIWAIERWTANKWDSIGGSGEACYQVKATLTKKVLAIATRDEINSLIEDAKTKINRPVEYVQKPVVGHLLEIAIPDLHVGKMAWGKETGHANYDVKIAEQVFNAALDALVARTRSYPIERILLPVGNDLLNTDNRNNTTTAGTPQDTDGRFQKSFTIARRMMTQAIERLREIAPVDVVMVPGNHDTLAVWHLGDSLSCWFHNYPDVTIDNAPTQRKYYQFGKVMLLFTHGDKGKAPDYPLLMATEKRDMWGATVHREAHTGHRHTTRLSEYHGVKVRISPALCPPDAWHSENHFVGAARAAEAFVWHKDEGLVGTAHFTVTEP